MNCPNKICKKRVPLKSKFICSQCSLQFCSEACLAKDLLTNHRQKEKKLSLKRDSVLTTGKLLITPKLDTSIKFKDLKKVKRNNLAVLLGSGAFGDVFLVKDANNYYALKEVAKQKITNAGHPLSLIYDEINTHAKLSHPNIVKIVNFFENDTTIYLVAL